MSRQSFLITVVFMSWIADPAYGGEPRENLRSPSSASSHLAQSYSQLVADLDAKVSDDSADVLAASDTLVAEFERRIQTLDASVRRAVHDPSFVTCGNRVVARDQLCSLVLQLGDVSRRVRTAIRWCDFAVRDERLKMHLARTGARRRTREELQRVYSELHSAAAAKRAALQELQLLASGRYRVVERDNYTGTTTPATPYQAWNYQAGLHAKVVAPVFVTPAVKTEAKHLFTVERLHELAASQPHIERLQRIVDAELASLAAGHLAQVRKALAGADEPNRMMAVASLGWWNGTEGDDLIKRHLHGASPSLRQSALVALQRLTHDGVTLKRLATDNVPEVRVEAAQLAMAHLHDYRAALGAVRILLGDLSDDVRRAGYKALDRLSLVFNATLPQQLRQIASVLRSPTASVLVAAIKWIEVRDDGGNPGLAQLKARYLRPLSNHKDASVQLAARIALVNLSATSTQVRKS